MLSAAMPAGLHGRKQNLYESEKVHVMDFNTSQKQEIVGEVNDYVRVLGFVGMI